MARQWIFTISLVSLVTLLLTQPVNASQEVSRAQERRIAKEVKEIRKESPELGVSYSRSGVPSSIEGVVLRDVSLGESAPERAEEQVQDFLTKHGEDLFLIDKPHDDVEVMSRVPDPAIPGRWLVKVRQRVNGVPVLGSESVFVIDPTQRALAAEAKFRNIPNIPAEPNISPGGAREVARLAYAEIANSHKDLLSDVDMAPDEGPAPQLVIVRPSDLGGDIQEFRLAWRTRIGYFIFFVDAIDSKVLVRYLDKRTALVRRTFDLGGGLTFPGALVLEDPLLVNTDNAVEDARLAHEFAKRTYDFYLSKLSLDSFDGAGGSIVSFVRFGGLQNAEWNPIRRAMIYGPGFAGSLDIVAHELTHAVTERQVVPSLETQGESGSIDEFYSDLAGALVEGNWIIGENAPGFQPPARPVRDMIDPHNGGFFPKQLFSSVNRGQPALMSEAVQKGDLICATSSDFFNGCVHFNSGILNKVASLSARGDLGQGVTGIGEEKVLRLFFSTLPRLSSISRFTQLAELSKRVCSDMAAVRISGITDTDCVEFSKAWAAVGLR